MWLRSGRWATTFLAAAFLAGAFFAAALVVAVFLAAAFLAGAFLAAVFLAAAFLAGAFLAGALAVDRPSSEATWVARSSRLVMPTAPSWRDTSERTVDTMTSVPWRPRSSSSSTRALASSVWMSPFFTSSDTSSSAFLRVMLVKAMPASM